jgi:FkbM family methyltransferase
MGLARRLQLAAEGLRGHEPRRRAEAPLARSYEEQIYQALVRPGDSCFDVGANGGSVAIFLAKLAGESGFVAAFEPVWPTYARMCCALQDDMALKAPIVPIPCGLAEAEKQAPIHIPAGDFAMASMADPASWAGAQRGAAIRSYQVRFTTVDGILESAGLRSPDFMKIDVEGAELFVLRGAAGLLRSSHAPVMLIELFAPWERAFGYQPWEPLSLLMDCGYRFVFACPTGMVEHVPTQDMPFPSGYDMGYNVVAYQPAAHRERVEAVNRLRPGGPVTPLPMPAPPQPNMIG